jgi:hypothetical protein
MRVLFASVVLVGVAGLILGGAQAGDKDKKDEKAVTLKGTITCAKCDLGKETTCMTVIVAKDKDKKDVTYYFDKDASKKFHGKICTEAKAGSVEGVVSTKDEKKIITVKRFRISPCPDMMMLQEDCE